MDDHPAPQVQTAPPDWLDALAQADADIAAGDVGTPWPEVRKRLMARIEQARAARARSLV